MHRAFTRYLDVSQQLDMMSVVVTESYPASARKAVNRRAPARLRGRFSKALP